jgi:hypothetical protein
VELLLSGPPFIVTVGKSIRPAAESATSNRPSTAVPTDEGHLALTGTECVMVMPEPDDDELLEDELELLEELEELLLEDELELLELEELEELLLDEELELLDELEPPLIEPTEAVSVTRSSRAPSSLLKIRSVCAPAARLLNVAGVMVA